MTNKIGNKRYNKLLSYRNNYYAPGGLLGNFGNQFKEGFQEGKLNAPITAIGGIAGNMIGGGKQTGAGNLISSASNIASAIPGPWGAVAGAGLQVLGGITNAAFGTKWNKENIAKTENTINNLRGLRADANSADTLTNMVNNLTLGDANFSDSYIGKDGWFSNKAARKARKLRAEMRDANDYAIDTLELNADNISTGILDSLESNYAALGGFINKYSDGGSIHINPANRGKFNATKKRTGKTTEELTHSKNPLTRKRAIFAQNASHWKHALGGELEDETPWYTPFLYNMPGATFKDEKYVGNRLLHPIGGKFGGGKSIGGGAESSFNVNDYSNLTFNEAFDKAYNNKEDVFKYGEKIYNTKKENNPVRELNNRFVGSSKSRSKLTKKDSYQHTTGPYKLKGLESFPMKFSFGGHLNTNGSDFMTGLTYIDNGDTHENNPYEGVPMGADSEGTPNLVEQGEVIFNDYVYSNRLQVPKAVRKKYKLRDNMTFADAVKYLTKSYEERPNDSISRDTSMEVLADLANVQEAERANESIKINKNKSAYGGKINRFDDGGNKWMPTAINPYKGVPNYYGYDKPFWMNDKGEYNKEYTDFINNVYNVDMFKKHLKDQFNFYDNATEEQKKSPRYAAIQNFIDTSPEWYENRNTIDDWVISDNLFNTAKKLAVDKNTGIMHVGDMFAQYKRGKANSLMPNGLFPNNLNDRIKTPDLIKNAGKEEPPLYLGRSNEALRYAPAIGLGAAVISDALGITNNPEYENAARIEAASRADYKPVGFERLGNYLKYRPFDTDYLLNRMDADAAASRRAIANQSAGNTGAAIAGLLASDYNTIGRLGEAKIAADKENFARRAQVEEFNRATNQYNSQGALQADTANQGAYANALSRRLTGLTTAAQMRQGIKDAAEANRAANISEFLSALGDIGYENKSMNIIRRLAESGALGGLSAGHPLAEEIATPGSRRKNKRRR
jgi:hypothetical protein|nr:MAG TPA: hypothetical protein [Crassvirales sp.]